MRPSVRHIFRKVWAALLRPLERTMAAGPMVRIGSAAIPIDQLLAAGVTGPPGPHKPGASGSNPGPAIREDVRDECQHDAAWPVEEQ